MQKQFVPLFQEDLDEKDIINLNPLVLSFIGDSVQTLYIRSKLGINSSAKTGKLHLLASKQLNATSQSIAMRKILDSLTDKELEIYKRARNSKTSSSAKNASITDYHIASGFEAVIGYLYLTKNSERINELMELGYQD
ncbi:MAG: ribonuclease III domain-containing protein [Bacillota bacterium]|jgi:ribonuclease-3 family protein|nr:ribonuclease III domain-containing protein [Bacillota bacterium]HHU43002.1 Mini-ribonuclease 3 [Clostridiales bacterium]